MADVDAETVKEIRIYLSILAKDFATERSPLNAFLSACGHGDIRLSLDLFRSFLLSGYTNVEEMVATRGWEVSNYLSEAARIEYGHFIKRQSLKRVEIRLERVARFNAYLRSEEEREREMYSLGMPQAEMFTTQLLAMFEAEKERIKRSAAKNLRGRQR